MPLRADVKRSFALLPPLLLAACAGEPRYEPPAGPDTARVRFTATNAAHRVLVTAYASEKCDHPATMGIVAGKPVEQPVRAARALVFSLQRLVLDDKGVTCSLSMSLTPAAGTRYEAEYAEDETQCYVTVYRLQPDGDKARDASATPTPKDCSR
jgi:hypothetical protein